MGQSMSGILCKAAHTGDITTVRKMIERRGMKADTRNEDGRGETPLYLACMAGHHEVAEFLIGNDANVNSLMRGCEQPSCLLIAVFNKHESIVRLLLKHGADATQLCDNGSSALHLAVEDANILKALLECGADPNIKDSAGSSALYYAALKGSLNSVAFLLEAKARVNARAKKGRTALHCAVKHHFPHIVRMLIDAGADVTLSDADGVSPLELAEDDTKGMLIEARDNPVRVLAEAEAFVPPPAPSLAPPSSEEKDDCKICFDAKIDCVILNCGHLATCFNCARQLRQCPICRGNISNLVKTFKA